MWQQRTFTLRFIQNKVLLKKKKATYILGACIKKKEEKKLTSIYSIVFLVHCHRRVIGLKAYRLFAKNTRWSTFEGASADLFLFTIFPAEEKTRSERTEDPGMERYFFAIWATWGYLPEPKVFHHMRGFCWAGIGDSCSYINISFWSSRLYFT